MSDLFSTREKVEKGADWRGSITVTVDGEQQELKVRQLVDTEFWEVMSLIDTEELDSLQSDLPEDMVEEYQELQEKDELDEDDQDRLEEIESTMEDEEDGLELFDTLSTETFEGIQKAAEYGVVPDEEDIQTALTRHADTIAEEYGGTSHDDAVQYIKDHEVKPMIENSTNFVSFSIGVKALGKTLGEMGN